ncbi:hypothetical protein [Providencia huashanensis]|uniref:hypothetical protein n=1 Tax=Providencia huashanensis TaxID=3037798 RepID=UPI002AFDDCE2|nr:hypothetical protein [Providencia sp. 23021821]
MAVVPQTNAYNTLNDLIERHNRRLALSDFEFAKIIRDAKKMGFPLNRLTEGVANVVYGRIDEGLSLIEPHVWESGAEYANMYCQLLKAHHKIDKLIDVVFDLSALYSHSKSLSDIALSVASNMGDLALMNKCLEEYLSLLSEDEGRSRLLKNEISFREHLSKLFDAKLCSEAHIKKLFLYSQRVLSSNPVRLIDICIATGDNSYVVKVMDVSSKEIVKMNNLLAEMVCLDEELDDCQLIARFSHLNNNDTELLEHAY